MTQTNLDRLKAYADAHAQLLTDNGSINPELYQTYGVKRGLRDQKGRGVLAGLTNISEIVSNKQVNGETVPQLLGIPTLNIYQDEQNLAKNILHLLFDLK